MVDTKKRFNDMLYNYETTYRTDFRFGTVKNLVFTTYKPKEICAMVRPRPLKNIHTLTDWKDTVTPFSLFHRPKEIIHISPTHRQERKVNFKDTELPEVIRTRPRVLMTPAVSIDDIADPQVRNLLLDNTYISSAVKAQREVEKPYFSVKAPLPKVPAPAKSVFLPKLQPGLVSPEWRMESVSWEQKQTRAYCNPTREFWKRRDPPQCPKCAETAAVQALRQTQREVMKSN